MDTKESESSIESMKNEITSWRNYFLDKIFSNEFKHMPTKYKNILRTCFLSTSSESFTDPSQEWHRCISFLLQHLEDKR